MDVGSLISCFSALSKFSLHIWKFLVYVLLMPSLEDLGHYLASMWNECNCAVVWTFFGIVLLWDWNENWPFPVPWPLLVFQICWHIECSTITVSSFRIWNNSAGIPLPPLTLFEVILPKVDFILLVVWIDVSDHAVMVTQVIKTFLYSSSVHFCHMFLIPSASFRFITFLSFIMPIFAWNVHLVSLVFSKKCLVFPILFFTSTSLHCSFKKASFFFFSHFSITCSFFFLILFYF